MLHLISDTVCEMIDGGATSEAPGLVAQVWMFVFSNPILAGVGIGAVAMLMLFGIRRLVGKAFRFVWTVATAPFMAAWKLTLGRRNRRMHRLPLVGEKAYLGPCRECGTKHEYRVLVTAYYGGTVRGCDTMSGKQVIGCPDCVTC